MAIKCGRCENGRKYQEALAIVDAHIPFDFPYRRRHHSNGVAIASSTRSSGWFSICGL